MATSLLFSPAANYKCLLHLSVSFVLAGKQLLRPLTHTWTCSVGRPFFYALPMLSHAKHIIGATPPLAVRFLSRRINHDRKEAPCWGVATSGNTLLKTVITATSRAGNQNWRYSQRIAPRGQAAGGQFSGAACLAAGARGSPVRRQAMADGQARAALRAREARPKKLSPDKSTAHRLIYQGLHAERARNTPKRGGSVA